MIRIKSEQSGFTLVELLLAMAFFSFILVFFTFGFIQINRTFQKGATIKRVTETGRIVIEDIARNVRLSSPTNFELMVKGDGNPKDVNRLCLSNGTRYGWNSVGEANQEQVDGQDFSFIKSRTGATCDADFQLTGVVDDGDDGLTLGANSLVPEGIVVRDFTVPIEPITSDFNGIRMDITLSTDDETLLSADPATLNQCAGFAKKGDQFCDTVRFTTSVTFRAAL